MTGWVLAWLSAGIIMADKALANEQQGISCACKRPPVASHITWAGNFTAWKQHCSTLRSRAGELCCAGGQYWFMETKPPCRKMLIMAARQIRRVYSRNTVSTFSAQCPHPPCQADCPPIWGSYLLKSHFLSSLCKLGCSSQVLDTAWSLIMQRSFLTTSQQTGFWFFFFYILVSNRSFRL